MAKKTNCTINGKDYYRLYGKVGTKITADGRERQIRKAFYGESKKDAEEMYAAYLQKMKEEQERKIYEATHSSEADKPMNVAINNWISAFFVNYDLADSTKKLYEDTYHKYFENTDVANKILNTVTAADIQDYYNSCDLKFSSLKAINKLLVNFYKHCELANICHDVMRPVKVPKKDTAGKLSEVKEIDVWDDADLQKVIEALSGTTLRFLVVLAVNSGARIGELCALTYDDIKDGILTINKQVSEVTYGDNVGVHLSDTKTMCSNRLIPLSDYVLKELETHRKVHQAEMIRCGYRTDLIFSTDNGNYYYRSNVRRRLEKVYKRIGVPVHKFHSFRSTFCTNLYREGVQADTVKNLMGHSSIDVSQRHYDKVDNERKLEAVSRITHFSIAE